MKWMLVILFAIVSPSLLAQTDSTSVPSGSTVVPENVSAVRVTATRVDTSAAHHSTKSAGLAMLFSAVVPGSGQFYNESYWKVPIVVGFGVYFASMWLHNNRRYHDYENQYRASFTADLPDGNGRFLTLREFYRDQRDSFTWYFAILYFLNVADAYVDASLYDFNVGDDLSIRLMPAAGKRVTLRVTF